MQSAQYRCVTLDRRLTSRNSVPSRPQPSVMGMTHDSSLHSRTDVRQPQRLHLMQWGLHAPCMAHKAEGMSCPSPRSMGLPCPLPNARHRKQGACVAPHLGQTNCMRPQLWDLHAQSSALIAMKHATLLPRTDGHHRSACSSSMCTASSRSKNARLAGGCSASTRSSCSRSSWQYILRRTHPLTNLRCSCKPLSTSCTAARPQTLLWARREVIAHAVQEAGLQE
jgi:hypothetical protein